MDARRSEIGNRESGIGDWKAVAGKEGVVFDEFLSAFFRLPIPDF